MVSAFACGSFSNQEEYDLDELLSPCSTPKRSRKSTNSKNPYADRGLDKFSKLLAELEGKKQKIYTQKGSEDISFVRFVYSGSDNWRPIVVKSKDRKMEKEREKETDRTTSGLKAVNPEVVSEKHEIETIKEEVESTGGCVEQCKIKEMIRLGNVDLRHPYFYLPLVMLFILILLTVYGRSFAILCTSLGWYLVPMIKERSSEKPMKIAIKKTAPAVNSVNSVISTTSEKPKSKKDYTRRHSEKSIVRSSSPGSSPNSVLAGPVGKSTSGRHSHKKSW